MIKFPMSLMKSRYSFINLGQVEISQVVWNNQEKSYIIKIYLLVIILYIIIIISILGPYCLMFISTLCLRT